MPIPNDMYNEYKLDVMLDCYKWDPQFCDNNTVAKYALVLSEKEHEELKLLTEKLIKETNVLLDKLQKIKIGNIVTINRLIETSLGFANGVGASKKLLDAYSKPSKRILNFLYKLDKERFLINFKSSQK